MYQFAHINTAREIIETYDGKEPFQHHLKSYLKLIKKAGSRDRKSIGHLCYTYLRIGRSMDKATFDERLATALFLCEESPNPYLQVLYDRWNHSEMIRLPIEEKVSVVKETVPDFMIDDVFPFNLSLSEGIDRKHFVYSHLRQPFLYLRLRAADNSSIVNQLEQSGQMIDVKEDCIALRNGTNIEELLTLNRDAVVQDKSSQGVRDFFPMTDKKERIKIWDACAASGGKAILLYDHYKNIELTVTDKRSSIIHNLRQRLHEAGINDYHSFVLDLTLQSPAIRSNEYDIVLADVPCSGSGTWSRTPEHLSTFTDSRVDDYQQLQRSILRHILPSLKRGGHLLYVTCSVFRKENEENVDWVQKEFGLKVVKASPITGYAHNADTMYAALLLNDS